MREEIFDLSFIIQLTQTLKKMYSYNNIIAMSSFDNKERLDKRSLAIFASCEGDKVDKIASSIYLWD